jgi:hypothetical protein
LQSISGWSFLPATKGGKSIVHWIRVPINFHLTSEAMDIPSLLRAIRAIEGGLLSVLGSLIWATGIVWSIILAKRQSILWLSCMVALWIVTYPLFVATHWSLAKRNLLVVVLGIALLCLGLYLASSQRLSI